MLISLLILPLSFVGGVHAEGFKRGPDTVRIGVVAPLSGEGKWMGERILKGVQHALSRRLKDMPEEIWLSVEDSRGDPAAAASSVRKLGEDQQVLAIIGPAFSESVIQTAQVATDMRVPTITPSAVSPGIARLSPYLFRNSITAEQEAEQLVDYAMRKMGLVSFSILYPLNSRGMTIRDSFKRKVEENGGMITYSFSYHPKDTDFGELLKLMGGVEDKDLPQQPLDGEEGSGHALSLEYQAIFIAGDAASASLIAPALQYYNMDGVRLLGSGLWHSDKLISWGGDYMEGAVFVDGFFAGSPWPQVVDFVRSFKQAFGEEPDILAAQAYDAASIVLDLIQSGIREREDMRDALLRVQDYPGASGYTTIQPSGEAKKELFILTVKDGKVSQIN
jgi:ABC-type branched-subunit amino acid transport system substrate-binding protein